MPKSSQLKQTKQKPSKSREESEKGPSSSTESNFSILESISDGVFTVDQDWKISYFNRAAEKITGIKRKEAIGKRCCDVFRSSMCQVNCPLKATLKNSKPIINRSCFIVRSDGHRIPISVSTAVLYDGNGKIMGGAETFRDLSEIEALRQELVGRFKLGDLISRSSTMRKVFDLIPAVASTFSTVLIQGETGTGKELVAKAVHNSGSFAGRPFVAINCGALPDSLLESELFGYKKGAFTGAWQDKPGLLQVAKSGTLFLDEIGDVSPAMQVKLLRVLQEKKFQPLGSTLEHSFQARVVAATNRDLLGMIKTGTFREDLFYRINVIRIDLPPLRQRKEDIPLLVDHFIERFSRFYGRQIKGISNEAISLLLHHQWPGNIRELENIIERAVILCNGKSLNLNCFPDQFNEIPRFENESIKAAGRSAESTAIQASLRRNGFNIEKTANDLEIHRATLYRKMRKYGLQPAREKLATHK
ncbi:MAG: sigma-54 interaction domain-containing protein [Candidatus Rifleibacteriota bacterium]